MTFISTNTGKWGENKHNADMWNKKIDDWWIQDLCKMDHIKQVEMEKEMATHSSILA